MYHRAVSAFACFLITSCPLAFCQSSTLAPRSPIDRAAEQLVYANQGQITDLASAVFTKHHITGTYRDVSQPVLSELVVAETNYHLGNIAPVTEAQVVAIVNHMAAMIAAPSYAYTNLREIRSTRVKLALIEPHFIGTRPLTVHSARSAGKMLVPAEMSPLEAFHVTATVFEQKLNNPDYQITEGERAQLRRLHKPERLSNEQMDERSNQLHQLLIASATKLSLADVFVAATTAAESIIVPVKGQTK